MNEILVIDDNLDIRVLISGILKEINYNKWVSIEMKKVEANNMKNLELCLEYVAEIYNQ